MKVMGLTATLLPKRLNQMVTGRSPPQLHVMHCLSTTFPFPGLPGLVAGAETELCGMDAIGGPTKQEGPEGPEGPERPGFSAFQHEVMSC